jgi:hypothetical protein
MNSTLATHKLPFKDAAGVHLMFSACAGAKIAVDRATVIPEWNEIGRVDVTSGTGEFLDAEELGTRFYRLRIVN